MYIELTKLYSFRQYKNSPIYYYFDKTDYEVVSIEKAAQYLSSNSNLDSQEQERFIPLFQVDEEQLEIDYLTQRYFNYPEKLVKKGFSEFYKYLEENLLEFDWTCYYKKRVIEQAKEWCIINGIVYKQ